MPATNAAKYSDYLFTKVPLVNVYAKATDQKNEIARLIMGEWLKKLSDTPKRGRFNVRYRGGEGWVDAREVSKDQLLEVYFINVGQGDSILIQTPDDRRILIDGGPNDEALKFIENKYRLDKPDNYIDFEAVIATHSDADHTQGLIKLLSHPKIGIKSFRHNGLFPKVLKKSGRRVTGLLDVPRGTALTPLMKKLAAALKKAGANLPKVMAKMNKPAPAGGLSCLRADASQGFIEPFGRNGSISLEVLWPEADSRGTYAWYVDQGKTVNGNSVVVRLTHGDNSILLAGDLNAASMKDLVAAKRKKLDSNVFKAAHHGSQDFDVGFLKAVAPDAGVVMSGDDRSDVYGHPRAVLMGTLTRYSKSATPAVFSNELAACFVPLKGKALQNFRANRGQLYERSIEGIIHLRSDGEQMYLATVYNRCLSKATGQPIWKWDLWPTAKA